jgi:hypothetical protein
VGENHSNNSSVVDFAILRKNKNKVIEIWLFDATTSKNLKNI